jgi:hypothetical protein
VSGFIRGGADGVGSAQPQLVPATILRKNFEFIAMIKPHEVPNRPEFYMIGSGITEAFLNALTIGATCTHEDWRAPCFTTAEIAAAKTQLNAEQVAFNALSVEEQAAHTAEGGLAVRSSTWVLDTGSCQTMNGQPSWIAYQFTSALGQATGPFINPTTGTSDIPALENWCKEECDKWVGCEATTDLSFLAPGQCSIVFGAADLAAAQAQWDSDTNPLNTGPCGEVDSGCWYFYPATYPWPGRCNKKM